MKDDIFENSYGYYMEDIRMAMEAIASATMF